MFYFLSKVLYALIAPLSIVLIFFALFLITKVKKNLYIALALLLFFTNPWLAQTIIKLYEVPPVNLKSDGKFEAIIVPSGFASNFILDGIVRANFNDGNDRMLQAIDLFHRGVAKKIIYTGGADTVFGGYIPEAQLGREFMMKCGIPDSCIIIETFSMNTHQNAAYTAKILDTLDVNWKEKQYVLVTAGFHMRRAQMCFEKQGFKVVPYSADLKSLRSRNTILNTIIPSYGGFQLWTYMIKEWIGLVVYKVKGYI
jgi:uncharacterized SAM-binding protein YcdF (DUF218 family)